MSTTLVSVGRNYHTEARKVWNLITDTGRWVEWGPTVADVDCRERILGPGTTGRVKTTAGLWLPFRVTEYEYGKHWRWRVASVHATGHRVEVTADAGCALWFDVPAYAAPYLVVCKMALGRIEKILSVEGGL